jgi:hypothetical protein
MSGTLPSIKNQFGQFFLNFFDFCFKFFFKAKIILFLDYYKFDDHKKNSTLPLSFKRYSSAPPLKSVTQFPNDPK